MMEAKHEYFEDNIQINTIDFLAEYFADTKGYLEIRCIKPSKNVKSYIISIVKLKRGPPHSNPDE